MSKWINKEAFEKFQSQKKQEADNQQFSDTKRSDIVWQTPEKGTEQTPKVYEGRFIPDADGEFYKKFYYHMFKSGEKWAFIICPKTDNFDNYCPWCSVTSKLYMGTDSDKSLAYNYKRKEKFVGNFYIVDDPRDSSRDEENKVNGTVKLYEFPKKIESVLKQQITDVKHGLGYSIFDPEEGYNFILKVLSTKPQKDKKVWPDYTTSMFSYEKSRLGSDSEISTIMKSTHGLNKYIESLKKSDDFIIKTLKDELMYDMVSDEIERNTSKAKVVTKTVEEDDIDDSQWSKEPEVKVEEVTDNVQSSLNDDISDDELLDELDKEFNFADD